ncbi:MAG: prolyl oligopeptidase family serine peptidase [Pseudomonadota bacterium]
MMWLGRALAEEGYIAVAVDHHGNTAAEESFDPRGFRTWWERSRDLTFALDALLANDTFGRLIDQDRLGAAGFSLGGYTVTALAGGQTDRELFRAFCASEQADATCHPQPEYPNADADLEALIEADPSIAQQLQAYKPPSPILASTVS